MLPFRDSKIRGRVPHESAPLVVRLVGVGVSVGLRSGMLRSPGATLCRVARARLRRAGPPAAAGVCRAAAATAATAAGVCRAGAAASSPAARRRDGSDNLPTSPIPDPNPRVPAAGSRLWLLLGRRLLGLDRLRLGLAERLLGLPSAPATSTSVRGSSGKAIAWSTTAATGRVLAATASTATWAVGDRRPGARVLSMSRASGVDRPSTPPLGAARRERRPEASAVRPRRSAVVKSAAKWAIARIENREAERGGARPSGPGPGGMHPAGGPENHMGGPVGGGMHPAGGPENHMGAAPPPGGGGMHPAPGPGAGGPPAMQHGAPPPGGGPPAMHGAPPPGGGGPPGGMHSGAPPAMHAAPPPAAHPAPAPGGGGGARKRK